MSASGNRSLVSILADETLFWMGNDPTKPDCSDELWAFALGTFVNGTPITPRGYDVNDKFTDRDGGPS